MKFRKQFLTEGFVLISKVSCCQGATEEKQIVHFEYLHNLLIPFHLR